MEPTEEAVAKALKILSEPLGRLSHEVAALRAEVNLLSRNSNSGGSQSARTDVPTAQLRQLRSEINHYRAEFLELVESITSERRSASDPRLHYFRIVLYVSSGKINRLKKTNGLIRKLLHAFDLVIISDSPPIKGSWWKEFICRTKDAISPELLIKLFSTLKTSMEDNISGKAQSEVNKMQAEAVKAALESIKDYDQVVMRVGSLLIVKQKTGGNNQLAIKDLTNKECEYLDSNSAIFSSPNIVLEALQDYEVNPQITSDST